MNSSPYVLGLTPHVKGCTMGRRRPAAHQQGGMASCGQHLDLVAPWLLGGIVE